jgi:tetratricopeptide (TPR) repeat protein/peroxiredoxin
MAVSMTQIRLTIVFVFLACLPVASHGAIAPGHPVPVFSLKDDSGTLHSLSTMKTRAMTILYFFDADSRPSIEGLLSLDRLATQFQDADLTVWAITRSPQSAVTAFKNSTQLRFPVLLDTERVSQLYDARRVLPAVCVVGPDLIALDIFQGGGKTTQVMLNRLAERQLARKKPEVAKALTDTVVQSDPGNVEARRIGGYAAMQEGRLDEAERTFYDLSQEKGRDAVLGKEGLAQVYEKKGLTEKSQRLAEEVARQASDRPLAHVIRGNQLYRQNDVNGAEAAFRAGTEKKGGAPFQRAAAFNLLGRLYDQRGELVRSRTLYDKAVSIDPYFVEATSNKGVTYEREGRWDKALEMYRQAEAIDRSDPFVRSMADNAMRMLMIQSDTARQQEVLLHARAAAERYQENRVPPPPVSDTWTSRATRVIFFDLSESGGLSPRAGFADLLRNYLETRVGTSGRIHVIDHPTFINLLELLKIDEQALADDTVCARLGQALEASLMIKGGIFHMPSAPLCNLKILTTTDARSVETIDYPFTTGVHLQNDLGELTRKLLFQIMRTYPLKAFVVEVTGNQVLLNLGSGQGVVEGTVFNVIEEKPPITYKGKTFVPEPAIIAEVHVVRTENDFSYGHIKNQRRTVVPDDKLKENVTLLDPGDQAARVW